MESAVLMESAEISIKNGSFGYSEAAINELPDRKKLIREL